MFLTENDDPMFMKFRMETCVFAASTCRFSSNDIDEAALIKLRRDRADPKNTCWKMEHLDPNLAKLLTDIAVPTCMKSPQLNFFRDPNLVNP